jgi:hypothetical protein
VGGAQKLSSRVCIVPSEIFNKYESSSQITLRKDVHGIVDLDVHMVTNRREIFALGRDYFTIPTLDLVRRGPFFGETAGDDDTVPIRVILVCFVALIFKLNRHFCSTSLDHTRHQR